MNNIFIEGLQGTGKTTLMGRMQQQMPAYRGYREGDLSPIALTWCSYMTERQYEEVCRRYEALQSEIVAHTLIEGKRRIVAYTQVLTDIPGFHRFMEQFEIYNGHVDGETFKEIQLRRYSAFQGRGNIFECSFFQNTLETMLLYYQMAEEEIMDFYMQVYVQLKDQAFKLIYLEEEDVPGMIAKIKAERIDNRGNEVWFAMMSQYIEHTPYGKKTGMKGLEGVMAHLIRRKNLEHKVMKEIIAPSVRILKARDYDLNEVLAWANQ